MQAPREHTCLFCSWIYFSSRTEPDTCRRPIFVEQKDKLLINFAFAGLKPCKLSHQLHQGVHMSNQCGIPRYYSWSMYILIILKQGYRKDHKFLSRANSAVPTSNKNPAMSSQFLENKIQTFYYGQQGSWIVLPNSDVMPNLPSPHILSSSHPVSLSSTEPKHILFPLFQILFPNLPMNDFFCYSQWNCTSEGFMQASHELLSPF